MARDYATIRCSIWGDEDWRTLTAPAQLLYLTLLTQGGMSFCGVVDYYPKRLAVLTTDASIGLVEAAADELEANGYIVIDRDTDEVFVRSFVRHDGILNRPNVAIAMAKNYHSIVSMRIRRAFVWELQRLHSDARFADLTAWDREKVREVLGEPSEDAKPNPLTKGQPKGSVKDCLTTASASASTTATQQPLPQTSEIALRDDRPDVDRLCTHLADRIESNGSKRPAIGQRWHDAARLLLDTDGHTEAEVHAAIDWCQADGFWRGNVMSMSKLREKYDQLRLAAQANRMPTRGGTDERVAGHLALAHRLHDQQQQLTQRPNPFGEIA